MGRFSVSNPYPPPPPFCYPTDHQAVCFLRVQKINCFVNPGRRTFISYVSFEASSYWFRSVSQSYWIFTFEIGDIFLLEKSKRATIRRIITKTQQNSHHQSRKRGRESSKLLYLSLMVYAHVTVLLLYHRLHTWTRCLYTSPTLETLSLANLSWLTRACPRL